MNIYFFFIATKKKDGRPNNLQKDEYSCSLFSLDHAIQSSCLPIFDILNNIHDKSNQGDHVSIFWDDLYFSLIWNAQSSSFLDGYLKRNQGKMTAKEKLCFKDYIKKHCITDDAGKKINKAIHHLLETKRQSAIQLLNRLEEDEIETIVSSSFLDRFSPIEE